MSRCVLTFDWYCRSVYERLALVLYREHPSVYGSYILTYAGTVLTLHRPALQNHVGVSLY